MGIIYKVNSNSTCLRYILPFKYGESFEKACNKVEAQKDGGDLWKRMITSMDGPESDLYGYIKNEFKFDSDTGVLDERKSGCAWLFWKSKEIKSNKNKTNAEGKIKEILYFSKGISKDDTNLPSSWDVTVSNVGLMLFRNSLGFIWYEIDISQVDADTKQLKDFQNCVRELNCRRKALFWEKYKEEPHNLRLGIVLEENEKARTYISPFSFGRWLQEFLNPLDISISYFADRKDAYDSMLEDNKKKLTSKDSKLPNEIIVGGEEQCKKNNIVPDKAILFTYASFDTEGCEDDLEDKQILAYHLTNGYKDTYHFSEDVSPEMKRPFEDVLWYATQEGAAYLSWPGEDNQIFFTNTILSKIKTDYFALYLKALYQSFSLLIYAEKIQEEISAVDGKTLIEKSDKGITGLFEEINLFLTKSMATSVSHIHHQSEFYIYLKKQLRIHDDVKSVTSGLNALDMLQRERRHEEEKKIREESEEREKKAEKEEAKRDGKIQAGLGLFSVLAISSALIDTFDFAAKFAPGAEGGWMDLLDCLPLFILEIILTVVIVIVGGFACSFAWKAFKESRKKEDDEE